MSPTQREEMDVTLVSQPKRKTKKRKHFETEQLDPSSQWILEKPKSYPRNDQTTQLTRTLQTRQPRRKKNRGKNSPPLEKPISLHDNTQLESDHELEPLSLVPDDKIPSQLKNFPMHEDNHVPEIDILPTKESPSPLLSSNTMPQTLPTEELQANVKKPQISGPHSTRILPLNKPMPNDEILDALFAKLLDRLNLVPEKIAEMNMMSSEQKWTLILAQDEMGSGLSCMYYVEQLVHHTQPALKQKKVKKSLLEKLHPLDQVLKGLEVELRTNSESWVNEFVASPCYGHIALIDLLKDLIEYPELLNTKLQTHQKYPVIQRNPTLIHTALICIRAVISNRQGFSAVINYGPSIYIITHCITFPHNKTKGLVLKLLIAVLLAPGGLQKVSQAFDNYQQVKGEHKKFATLVNSMFHEPIDPDYQAEVLRFINTVIQTAGGLNAKVFHQEEFINAGLDIKELEQSYSTSERIAHEIKEWKKGYTNVQQLVDNLMITRGRARSLKQELDMTLTSLRETRIERDNYYEYSIKAQKKIEKLIAKMKSKDDEISQLIDGQQERNNMVKRINQLEEINERYREHTAELRIKIGKFVEEKEMEGLHIDPSLDLQEQIEILQKYKMTTSGTQTTQSMTNLTEEYLTSTLEAEKPKENEDQTLEIPPAPPIPLPPPLPGTIPLPPTLEANTSIRKPYITNLPLPTLNWIPLRNSEHTIFDSMNDEVVIEEVDFSEFEALFQVPRFKSKELKFKEKAEKRVELLDAKRARTIVFAKRRVKQQAEAIAELVENVDLDGLVCDHVELLMQILPSDTEKATLAKNAKDYDKFGEAEQYLYQLAKIERLEERLSVMSFIGNFDELILQTQPKVNAVLNASLSIFRSSRLKKVFEIILAFGNYMNSSKRGTVTGFKLASLQRLMDTKSTDKQQHLLHYIVDMVEKQYPNVFLFYEDINVEEACEEMVDADINNLKLGHKTLQEEHEMNPKNFILYNFSKLVTKKLENLLEQYQNMKDAYTEVCLMFSESSKEEPDAFFGYFRSFIASWKAAIKDNRNRRKNAMNTTGGKNVPKKQNPEKIMKDIAAEAAIVASSKMKKIREQTLKLDKKEEREENGEKNHSEVFHVQLKPVNVIKNEDISTQHQQTSTKDFKKSKTKGPFSSDNELFDDEYYSSMINGSNIVIQ